MIGRIVLIGVAGLTVSGCGGHGHTSTVASTDSTAAKATANWTIAARTFNASIQRCARQPNPLKGYWADCTRDAQRGYAKAAAALRATATGSRSGCTAAVVRAKSLERQMTEVLGKAWRANRAFLTAAGYHGPPSLFAVNHRADRIATRDTTLADRLAPALRRACAR